MNKKLFALLLALLSATILLTAPLTASLWLDETLSAWVATGSLRWIIQEALDAQGQSPLYFIILRCVRELSDLEVVMRLPSLLFSGISLFVFYRLVKNLADQFTAQAATIMLLTSDGFLRAAVSARPYALALMLALAATLSLITWTKKDRPRFTLYILLLGLAFYAHYLFLGILLVHVVLIYELPKASSRSVWFYLRNVALLILLCGMGFTHLLLLWQRSSLLALAPAPKLSVLIRFLFPAALGVCALLSLLLGLIMSGSTKLDTKKFTSHAWIIACSWWLLGPIAVFIHDIFAGTPLFLPRYLLWAIPGCCFLYALVLGSIPSSKARIAALSCLMLLVLVRESGRTWQIEDWRGVANLIRAYGDKPELTVYANTGLIEGRNTSWYLDHLKEDYLLAPFGYYKVSANVQATPSDLNDSKFEFVRDEIKSNSAKGPVLLIAPRVPLYGEAASPHQQISEFITSHGGKVWNTRELGLIAVSDFEWGK